MSPGSVIRMHMHAAVRSALHNQCYSCMRLVAYTYHFLRMFLVKAEKAVTSVSTLDQVMPSTDALIIAI